MADDLATAIRDSAGRLGIDPSDLATAISFETGGTFDPWKKGPTTQWGEHRGLIQWGEPQRKKYGVTQDMSVADQMKAAEQYLTDAGVKPGHGLLDVYAAINAGRVGRYGASDAANGGAPGSVADKVASMAGHRVRANALLGVAGDGQGTAVAPGQPGGGPAAVAAPMSLAPSGGGAPADDGMAQMIQGLAAIQQTANEPFVPVEVPAIRYASPPGLARARALSHAMSNRRLG